MKKLLAIVILLTMLLSSAIAEAIDLNGVWYIVEVQNEGFSYNPKEMGLGYELTLDEDGTMSLVNYRPSGTVTTVKEGRWVQIADNAIMIPDDVIEIRDNHLLIEKSNEFIFIFGRDPDELSTMSYEPQPVAAESEDVFLGKWKMARMFYAGMLVPAEIYGASGNTMVIEKGKASFDMWGQSIEISTAFSEGELIINYEGKETGRLILNDDGTVSHRATDMKDYEIYKRIK